MESGRPDNCHQKSFPITRQAFRALRLTDSYYRCRIKTWRPPRGDQKMIQLRWYEEGSPLCLFFVPLAEAPWKAEVKKIKNTQGSRIFKLFQHRRGPRCATERSVRPKTLRLHAAFFPERRLWILQVQCKSREHRAAPPPHWFPSHTGSPLKIWHWMAQKKRNPQLKGQESHRKQGGGGWKEILTSLEKYVPSEIPLSMCADGQFMF